MSLEQAQALAGVGRWQDARDALAPSLADPQSGIGPWCLLAQCELGLGRPAAAREAAGRALALAPQQEWPYRLLSLAEQGCGRLPAAQEAAERACALSPGAIEPVFTLIRVLVARRMLGRAEQIAGQALAASPGEALAWEAAAMVSLQRGRWVEGEGRARRGLAISPQDADLMLQLGAALQGQRRHAESAQLYAAAAQANPRDQRARQALGEVGLRISTRRPWGRARWLLLILPQAWIGMALGHAIAAVQRRRARSGLSPQLRAVAVREARRASAVRWLVTAVVLAVAAAGLGSAGRAWPAGLALTGALLCVRLWARWAPDQVRRCRSWLRRRAGR